METETAHKWRIWQRNPGHRATRQQGYRRTNTHTEVFLPNGQPTTVNHHMIKRMQGTAEILPEPPPPNAYWWYEVVDAPTDITPILQGLIKGTAIWVTNGSFKEGQGTSAFTLLASIDTDSGVTLINQTPGRKQDIDAYRAEVAGIYGCIAFTNKLVQEHQIKANEATMACDCLSALHNIFMHTSFC